MVSERGLKNPSKCVEIMCDTHLFSDLTVLCTSQDDILDTLRLIRFHKSDSSHCWSKPTHQLQVCFQGPFPADHNCYDIIILARYTNMQQSERLLNWITSHEGFKKTFEGKKTIKENWHSSLSVDTCKFLRRSRASDDKTLASIICLRSSASLPNHHHHIEHVQHRTPKLQLW